MAEKTQVDKIFSKIKNNPVLAAVIALGVIVIALSSFTKAAKSLIELFTHPSANVTATRNADVTGTWKTQALPNQYNKKQKFVLTFEFDAKGTALLGTLILTPLGDNRSYKRGIRDGEIKGNAISFYTNETGWLGKESVTYKDLFHGTVSNDRIEFIQSSDRPWDFTPQQFIAEKVN